MNPDQSIRYAIRAPEYFPRVSYLALMAVVDVFVIADTFQYSRQSYHNRMQIRTPEGRRWLSIPLASGKFGKMICDVAIDSGDKHWMGSQGRTMAMNYRSSPFYEFYEPERTPVVRNKKAFLGDLTVASVLWLHRHFGLSSKVVVASNLEGRPSTLPAICNHLGISKLVALSDTIEHDRKEGANVSRISVSHPVYHQVFTGFEKDLSGLDLLYNYGPEAYAYLGIPT